MSRVHVVGQGKRTQKTADGALKEKVRGIVKAEAAQRRVKEFQDNAAERGTKRTKSSSSSSGGDAARTGRSGEGNGSSWVEDAFLGDL